jgi:chemotaxis family two-component system sensor histidine kinase/response regulator PixL
MDTVIRDQAYQFFVQEARDFLNTIEAGLLSLREDSGIANLHNMMRSAHSIKGGAASVELPAIQQIAHRLEDIFRALYSREGEPIPVEVEELLLQAFDCLRQPLIEQIERGFHDGEQALANAEEIFQVVEAYFGDALGAEVELPTAKELGFDIVQTVFTSDIPQGIERLRAVLNHPEVQELGGELRAQMEVFVGIGELLNLEGFTTIARKVISALDQHPDQARQLAEIAIRNLESAQALVLGGDRTTGGQPSAELLQFGQASPVLMERPTTDIKETPTPLPMTDTVRVDLFRMDLMNNQLGELVTQENVSLLQMDRLQASVTNLQRCFERFQLLTDEVRKWIDTSQKQEVSQSQSSNLGEFDPLQLDSYGYFYIRMQEVVEEMGQMQETMRDMQLITQQAQQNQRRKQQTLKQMRDNLLRARMLPLNEIMQRFPRMIRDLSVKYGKQVRLKISGGNTLVDKSILEKLYDPLVHLIRNSFDHGTETPEVRQQKGKPPTATIEISAYHRGNQTYIEVSDDGQGIRSDRVKSVAIARQMLSPAQAEEITPSQVYQLLFEPAFSTAEQVSELSGRGVGLSSVKQQVQALKGTITVNSQPDVGTTFSIRLPLSLTVTKLLVFSIDKNLMAIPVDSLEGIFTAAISELQMVQGRQFYVYDDELIPVYPVSAFNRNYPLPPNSDRGFRAMELPIDIEIPLLLLSGGIALEVDYIIAEQELAIKPFSRLIPAPPYLYGCTILGDGSLVPVIDGAALVRQWQDQGNVSEQIILDAEDSSAFETSRFAQATILVIDDSLTARETLSLTLKKAGYRVLQAGDGQEALSKLQQDSSIKAIFCDIEMPTMNGFEFLNQYRQDYPNSDRPIVMLTTRNSEKHRALAKMLGATAYLTKPYIEQELVSTLERVLVP